MRYWLTNQRFLELVGFDAANEERVALPECGHEKVERALELRREGDRLAACLLPAQLLQVLGEQGLQELVLCLKHNMRAYAKYRSFNLRKSSEQVFAEAVLIFVQETAGIIEDHSSKMLQSEGGARVRARLQVVRVGLAQQLSSFMTSQ